MRPYRRSHSASACGALSVRQRPGEKRRLRVLPDRAGPGSGSRGSPLLAALRIVCLAALAVAGMGASSATATTEGTAEEQSATGGARKPHGGRIRLVPIRNRVIRITAAEGFETTPWKKDEARTTIDPTIGTTPPTARETVSKSQEEETNQSSPTTATTLWTTALPFLQRGLLLLALTTISIAETSTNPPVVVSNALATGAGDGLAPYQKPHRGLSWPLSLPSSIGIGTSNIWLDWNKLWEIPGEVLPSLSSALLIAWVPSLALQEAWWELGFLALSVASQPTLRRYLQVEVLPSLAGTLRKLLWSEFWKQAWDYLLEPFPHNLLVPPKGPLVFPSSKLLSSSSSSREKPQSQASLLFDSLRSEISGFWNKRIVSRVDKWTTSSMKSVLQKNVQATVNDIADDSWNAFLERLAFRNKGRLLPSSVSSIARENQNEEQKREETARMIEIETACEENAVGEDGACENDDRNDETTVDDAEEDDTLALPSPSASPPPETTDIVNDDDSSSDTTSTTTSTTTVVTPEEVRIAETPQEQAVPSEDIREPVEG